MSSDSTIGGSLALKSAGDDEAEQSEIGNRHTTQIQEGREVDRATSRETAVSRSWIVANPENGESSDPRFFGTSVRTSVNIESGRSIRLALIAEHFQSTGQLPATESGHPTRRIQKRIQTETELREGQSLVVAGFVSATMTTEVSRIPVLGDVPLVGRMLFSSKVTRTEQSELLFVVTPHIVPPLGLEVAPTTGGIDPNRVQPAVHSRPVR
jgi:Bacterial type II and III secretion system protein